MTKLSEMVDRRGKIARIIFIIIGILLVVGFFFLLWKFNGMDIYSAENALKNS